MKFKDGTPEKTAYEAIAVFVNNFNNLNNPSLDVIKATNKMVQGAILSAAMNNNAGNNSAQKAKNSRLSILSFSIKKGKEEDSTLLGLDANFREQFDRLIAEQAKANIGLEAAGEVKAHGTDVSAENKIDKLTSLLTSVSDVAYVSADGTSSVSVGIEQYLGKENLTNIQKDLSWLKEVTEKARDNFQLSPDSIKNISDALVKESHKKIKNKGIDETDEQHVVRILKGKILTSGGKIAVDETNKSQLLQNVDAVMKADSLNDILALDAEFKNLKTADKATAGDSNRNLYLENFIRTDNLGSTKLLKSELQKRGDLNALLGTLAVADIYLSSNGDDKKSFQDVNGAFKALAVVLQGAKPMISEETRATPPSVKMR